MNFSQIPKLSLLLLLVVLFILLIPLPAVQTVDLLCSPCVDQPGRKCPPCPQKGDIVWNSPIAFQLAQKYKERSSIELTKIIEEIPVTAPYPLPRLTEGEIYLISNIKTFKNNLAVDGNCIVTEFNGYGIQIKPSGERLPTLIPKEKGIIEGISCSAGDDLSSYVGKKIEVFGKLNGSYISVEGDERYFIKVDVPDNTYAPPIVNSYLCGDYCPGPDEKYTSKVFQGVFNPD